MKLKLFDSKMPSDDGYSSRSESESDDDAVPSGNLMHRKIRRARRLRPRYCVVQSYVKWGEHVHLCMRCYTAGFGELEEVHFISSHFTVGVPNNNILARCSLCRERLFTVFHISACLICNRM